MGDSPDPRTMSRDELVAYFDSGGDLSELLRDATVGGDFGPPSAVQFTVCEMTARITPSETINATRGKREFMLRSQ